MGGIGGASLWILQHNGTRSTGRSGGVKRGRDWGLGKSGAEERNICRERDVVVGRGCSSALLLSIWREVRIVYDTHLPRSWSSHNQFVICVYTNYTECTQKWGFVHTQFVCLGFQEASNSGGDITAATCRGAFYAHHGLHIASQ